MVPFFTDKAELDQLIEWILNARLDPDNTPFPGLLGSTSIWIPIRFVWLVNTIYFIMIIPFHFTIYGKLVSIVSGAPPDFRGDAPGIRDRFF